MSKATPPPRDGAGEHALHIPSRSTRCTVVGPHRIGPAHRVPSAVLADALYISLTFSPVLAPTMHTYVYMLTNIYGKNCYRIMCEVGTAHMHPIAQSLT